MRKPSVVLAILTALLALSTLTGAQEAAEKAPKLVVPEKIIDLGVVPKGEVVPADFKIVNEGTDVLEIKAARPTCGCTVAEFDREIAPGETGWVKARINTKDFNGPIAKSIMVLTNDPETPTSSLVIKAEVKPYVEVLPRPLVRFNAVQREAASEKVILASGPDDPEFHITEVESSVPYITSSVRTLTKDELIPGKSKRQYELTLSLADDAKIGPLKAQVVVHTDHPKAKSVPIRVFGVVRALLHVTPPELQFGTVDAKAKPGRNLIVVNNRAGASVELKGASVDDPAFEVKLYPIEEGRRFQVTVAIKPDAAPGARDATLTIDTSDPDFPELKVPIRAHVR